MTTRDQQREPAVAVWPTQESSRSIGDSVESGANETTERITRVWRRVLRKPDIGPNDNFFDLGGDFDSAADLFREISQICGRRLPAATIYCAPTIKSLAGKLAEPGGLRFPPVVRLRAGGDKPPIFMVHGLDGTVMDFFHLTKHIRPDHPIYGLQAKGIQGMEQPHNRIGDMAPYFLEGIRAVQPKGPYFLIGYSLGGLVMLEIAQRLSQERETVALLAMVESYPHRGQLSVYQHARLSARLAWHHVSILVRSPFRDALAYPFNASLRRSLASRERRGTNDPESVDASWDAVAQSMHDNSYEAGNNYSPRFYQGRIKFVKAADRRGFFPYDPRPVWRHLAKEIDIETVPGDHTGVLETHFQELGSVLSRFLQEATVSKGASQGQTTGNQNR